MAIAVRREQDVAVLEWTRRDVGKLADAVRQELKDGVKRLLLDLSGVDYLKGGGFETLTEVLSAANDAEAVIGMCNVDRGIGIIMNQLGLGPGFFPPDLGPYDEALPRIQELEHQPLPEPEEESTDLDAEAEPEPGLEISFDAAGDDDETAPTYLEEPVLPDSATAVSHDTPTDHERSIPDQPLDLDSEAGPDEAPAPPEETDADEHLEPDSNAGDLADALGIDFDAMVLTYQSQVESDEDLELDVGDLLPDDSETPSSSTMRSLTDGIAGTVVMELDDLEPVSAAASDAGATSTSAADDPDVIDLGEDLFGDDSGVSSTSPTPPQSEQVILGPQAFADQPVEDYLGVSFSDLATSTTAREETPDDVSTDLEPEDEAEVEDEYEASWTLEDMGEPATFPATSSDAESQAAEPSAPPPSGGKVPDGQPLEDALGVSWDDLPGAAAERLGPHRVEEVQIPDEMGILDLGDDAEDDASSQDPLEATTTSPVSEDSTFDIDQEAMSTEDMEATRSAEPESKPVIATAKSQETTISTEDELIQTLHFLERYGFRKQAQLQVLDYLVQLSERVTTHTVRDVELGTGVGTGTVKATLDRFDRFGLLQRNRAKSMFQRDVYHFQPDHNVLDEARVAVSRYRTAGGQTRINAWFQEESGIPG